MESALPSNYIYLDWAATAPLSPAAREALEPYLIAGTGSLAFNMNANSLHRPGRQAFAALEEARKSIAADLGASRPSEIVFTSGATEADNAALLGMAHGALERHPHRNQPGFKPKAVVSAIEHDAVLAPADRLAREGFEVVRLRPDRNGFVSEDALRDALDADTVLVSVQMANSEVGSIQPVAALAQLAHGVGALFHSDATQALGKVPLNLAALEIDAASFSAHKIGGPKGVGALYLRARTPFQPQMLGGGQEDGRRSTTQNVAGAAAFAAAVHEAVAVQPSEAVRQRAMRDRLYSRLGAIDGLSPTVAVEPESDRYLPNIVSVLSRDFESETLILRLDARGFGVSGGSACSSHSLDPSHVLKALGYGDEAYGALRISFGSGTSEEDLDEFVQALTDCLAGS